MTRRVGSAAMPGPARKTMSNAAPKPKAALVLGTTPSWFWSWPTSDFLRQSADVRNTTALSTSDDPLCLDRNRNEERTHETDPDRNAGAVCGLCVRRLRRRQKSTERDDVVPNALRVSATAGLRLAERTG